MLFLYGNRSTFVRLQKFQMKKLVLILFISLSSSIVKSQRVYFIYLQSENQKPFYVSRDNSTSNSSSGGYILISKLYDSTYTFKIGFSNAEIQEQQFVVKMYGKDHDYLIKNYGEKGWALFEKSTGDIIYNSKSSTQLGTVSTNKNESSNFADLLSKASDDPTLNEKKVLPVEKKEIAEEKPKVKEEKAIIQQEAAINENKVSEAAQKPIEKSELVERPFSRTVVTKKSESSTTQGFGLVYIDESSDGVSDTIQLIIPNSTYPVQKKTEEPKIDEKKFIDIPADNKTATNEEAKTIIVAPVKSEQPNEKKQTVATCEVVASDNDFLKLRKFMAAAENDEGMLSEAGKFFKTMCFKTEQVKNLSTLFLTDEGKYRFFDIAYTHISDVENFQILGQQIMDTYYLNRFKAMLRN